LGGQLAKKTLRRASTSFCPAQCKQPAAINSGQAFNQLGSTKQNNFLII